MREQLLNDYFRTMTFCYSVWSIVGIIVGISLIVGMIGIIRIARSVGMEVEKKIREIERDDDSDRNAPWRDSLREDDEDERPY